jgi:hypothetical protein
MSDMGRQGVERVTNVFEHMLHEQPLVLGALGMALGAALAAGLPSTRREDELMGRTRDELMNRAREKGREQMDKVGRVTESAQEAARHEAEREGLTREAAGEQLQETYEKVKRVSTAAKDAAKEEARNHPS